MAEKPWGRGAFDNIASALICIGMSDATPPVPAQLSTVGRHLVSCCLQRQPDERPNAAELIEHDFVHDLMAIVPGKCAQRS